MIEILKKWWFITPEEEAKSEDAVNTRVLPQQRRSTLSMVVFAVAFAYTVTAFMCGESTLSGAVSSEMFWRDMVVGYGLLTVMAFLCGYPAYKTGYNTALIWKNVFGTKGGIVPGIIIAVLLVFHSGFQCSTFGELLFPTGSIQFILACAVCGLLMIWAVVKGIRGLETAANIAIGFLVISVGVCLYLTFRDIGGLSGMNALIDAAEKINPPNETYLLNVIIGSWSIGACNSSNWSRFCKNGWSLFLFIFVTYFVGQIVLAVIGATSILTVDTYLFTVYASGVNKLFGIFCVIAFLLALWTTLNGNIYMTQIPMAAITRGSIRAIGTICGVLAGIMGAFSFSRFAQPVLNFSGVLLPPFLGPTIVDYYMNSKYYYYAPEVLAKHLPKWNWVSFAASIAALICSQLWIPGWMPEAIWSIVLSAIFYIILFYILKACGIRSGVDSVEIDEELEKTHFKPYTPSQREK